MSYRPFELARNIQPSRNTPGTKDTETGPAFRSVYGGPLRPKEPYLGACLPALTARAGEPLRTQRDRVEHRAQLRLRPYGC